MAISNKPIRSAAYQYLMVEQSHDPWDYEFLSQLAPDDQEFSEHYKDLNEKAIKIFFNLVRNITTPRQLEVVELLLQGKNQWESAKILGCNQSSIAKLLGGNSIYKQGEPTREYGGMYLKIKMALLNCEPLRQTLYEMEHLDD